ncbi:MAG: hypothetical protein ACLF0G_13285 [Candidatus Brocadiia bacterium]
MSQPETPRGGRRAIPWGLAWVAALAMACGPAAGAPRELEGRLSLELDGAVFQRRMQDGELVSYPPVPLQLDVACHDGQWGNVIGVAPTFNKGHHRGRVLEAQRTADGARLTIEMRIASDPWIKGGRGLYRVALEWAGEGRLEGQFTGEFGAGHWGAADVAGKAVAELVEPRDPPEDFVPFEPGEHPRILFRERDIPRIKARTQESPVTEAAWRRVQKGDHMVALGVLYQLTGDEAYARQAKPLVAKRMKERGAGAFSTGHVWGARLADVARTFDLCTEAWDEDFNDKAVGYIEWITERLIYRPNSVSPKVNWSPNSNYHCWLRGGAAIGSLALVTDKGDEPQPPRDPGTEPLALDAPRDFQPGEGVPVVPYADGEPLKDWLLAGPLKDPRNRGEDYLAHLGGSAQAHARLAVGSEVRFGDRADPFEPLPQNEKFFWDDRVEFTAIYRRNYEKKEEGYHSTAYFYTVVRNDQRRLVHFLAGASGGTDIAVWLAGQRVHDQDYVELPAGLLPVLVRAHIFETSPWGKIWMEPRFIQVSRKEAADDLARRQVLYKLALAEWREDHAAWKASDGADPNGIYLAKLGRYHMAQCYRTLMGDGGWQVEGETYTLYSIPLPLEYAAAHLKMFGTDVTGRPDVSHFPCRYVAQTLFGGKRLFNQSFSLANGTMGSHHYSRVFPVVPEDYKPAVLWAWHQAMGLSPEGQGTPKFKDAVDAVYTLLHYPLGMEAKNPGQCLPRVWVASTKGGYIFRNRWEDTDDIVAQVGLKSEGLGGWSHPDAATLRIYGLGHPWAVQGVGNSKAGSRWFENVVMLPDDDICTNAAAHALHFEGKDDGSGTLVADLNEVYMGRQPAQAKRHGAKGSQPKDLGIRGTRSFAVDYSGRAGAPALFVVADHISGGGRKIWMWQLPKGVEPQHVDIGQGAFAIRQGEATLQATFVRPSKPHIEIAQGTRHIHLKYGKHGDVELNAIHATNAADPKGGQFVVILTLQRGPAPEVTVRADEVAVGDQTVRFDGPKILIGP